MDLVDVGAIETHVDNELTRIRGHQTTCAHCSPRRSVLLPGAVANADVMRTVSLGPNGFEVSDDVEGLLGRFLNTNVLGDHAGELATLFAPDGEGFYIPSLGGAQRLEDRDRLRPPYDADPAIDPERVELWTVERERPRHAPLQIVLTGNELRALLAEAQRLAAEQRRK